MSTSVKSEKETEARPKHNFTAGEYVSYHNYGKVLSTRVDDYGKKVLKVQPLVGEAFDVHESIFQDEAHSASLEVDSKKVSQTELAHFFVDQVGDAVFTICFTKQDGTERTLIGRRFSDSDPILGYSKVLDLEASLGSGKQEIRQINHREILWVVCKGVKMELNRPKSKKVKDEKIEQVISNIEEGKIKPPKDKKIKPTKS